MVGPEKTYPLQKGIEATLFAIENRAAIQMGTKPASRFCFGSSLPLFMLPDEVLGSPGAQVEGIVMVAAINVGRAAMFRPGEYTAPYRSLTAPYNDDVLGGRAEVEALLERVGTSGVRLPTPRFVRKVIVDIGYTPDEAITNLAAIFKVVYEQAEEPNGRGKDLNSLRAYPGEKFLIINKPSYSTGGRSSSPITQLTWCPTFINGGKEQSQPFYRIETHARILTPASYNPRELTDRMRNSQLAAYEPKTARTKKDTIMVKGHDQIVQVRFKGEPATYGQHDITIVSAAEFGPSGERVSFPLEKGEMGINIFRNRFWEYGKIILEGVLDAFCNDSDDPLTISFRVNRGVS